MLGDVVQLGATTARVHTVSPLTVRYDGQNTPVNAQTLASYTPVAGDKVATIPLDVSRRLILGKTT